MEKVPKITFSNGQQYPVIGLGTWMSTPSEVEEAVKMAISCGYRHIDCAWIYGNEKDKGKSLKAKFDDCTVKREDLYITSKLWNTFHRPDLVPKAIEESLTNLGLDYLDLYLMHWPIAYQEGGEGFPKREDGSLIFSSVDYVDTWKEMEKLQKKGLTKSIGFSNFNKGQIERILSIAEVKPVNLQVECHAYFNQRRLIQFCRCNDIVVTAYSPLGSPESPFRKPGDVILLEDPRLKKLASKYCKSPAQMLLRYQIDRGLMVIPKSVEEWQLKQNFDVFDFSLSKIDIAYMDNLDCNTRFLKLERDTGHPHHPFENDDF